MPSPNTNEVRINQEMGTLIRDGVPSIINPDDKNALEEALKIRDIHGGKVKVISMGPMQAKNALKEALAMGADEAYLISDRVLKRLGSMRAWACAVLFSRFSAPRWPPAGCMASRCPLKKAWCAICWRSGSRLQGGRQT